MLVWVDTETTGLESYDRLLEVGFIVTDDSLNSFQEFSICINDNDALSMMSNTVWDMHESSGLIGECRASSHDLISAQAILARELQGWLDPNEDPPPMTGNTVHFDRRMLKEWMPEFHDLFHYRNIDVSTLKELARRYAPVVFQAWKERNPEAEKPHRVIPDLENSIEEFDHYMQAIRNGVFHT